MHVTVSLSLRLSPIISREGNDAVNFGTNQDEFETAVEDDCSARRTGVLRAYWNHVQRTLRRAIWARWLLARCTATRRRLVFVIGETGGRGWSGSPRVVAPADGAPPLAAGRRTGAVQGCGQAAASKVRAGCKGARVQPLTNAAKHTGPWEDAGT